jgi:uncharacterized protein YfaA (DUF2138 family)
VSPIFKEGKKDTKASIFDTHDDQLRSIATALSTTDSAFAGKKKYEKSQALSQANACGNVCIATERLLSKSNISNIR